MCLFNLQCSNYISRKKFWEKQVITWNRTSKHGLWVSSDPPESKCQSGIRWARNILKEIRFFFSSNKGEKEEAQAREAFRLQCTDECTTPEKRGKLGGELHRMRLRLQQSSEKVLATLMGSSKQYFANRSVPNGQEWLSINTLLLSTIDRLRRAWSSGWAVHTVSHRQPHHPSCYSRFSVKGSHEPRASKAFASLQTQSHRLISPPILRVQLFQGFSGALLLKGNLVEGS